MSETFKASNGIEVAWKQEGTIPVLQTNAEGCTARVATRPGWEVVGAQHPDSSGVGFGKGSETHKALREFFQHERDQELGRWRWPENPDYVVYRKHVSEDDHLPCVRVVHEMTGRSRDVGPEVVDACDSTVSRFGLAARAYFAAHPEPKPWMLLPEGVYAVTPQVHPYERLLQFRDGKWLHLYRGPGDGKADPHTAEWCAEKAHGDGRLTRLVPEVSDVA